VPEALTRLKAQLTALDMEKQALLEDIAVGNSAHGERLARSNRTKSASSWNSTNWKRSRPGAEADGTTAGLPRGYLSPGRNRDLQTQH
jgi:hypothetical protein